MELGTHPLLLFSLVTLISVLGPLMGRILSHRHALSCGPSRIGPALRKMLSIATQISKLVGTLCSLSLYASESGGNTDKNWGFESVLNLYSYPHKFCDHKEILTFSGSVCLSVEREKLHYPLIWNCEHEREKARHKAECLALGDCPVNDRHGFKCMLCSACLLKGGLNALLK